MPAIPCFLCGKQLKRRIDKNRKPYFICDPCGTQIFIRRKQGIDNLFELIATLRGRDLPFREHARVLYTIQAVLAEIRGLKKRSKRWTENSVCLRAIKIKSANGPANCCTPVSRTC